MYRGAHRMLFMISERPQRVLGRRGLYMCGGITQSGQGAEKGIFRAQCCPAILLRASAWRRARARSCRIRRLKAGLKTSSPSASRRQCAAPSGHRWRATLILEYVHLLAGRSKEGGQESSGVGAAIGAIQVHHKAHLCRHVGEPLRRDRRLEVVEPICPGQ